MNRYRLVAAEATMNVTTAADAAQCLTMVAAASPAATTVAADLAAVAAGAGFGGSLFS